MYPKTTELKLPDNIYIVGCGGVASYLLPPLSKLLSPLNPRPTVTFVDGDILEERNIDRQLFNVDDIGKPKAEALESLYEWPGSFRNDYFTDGSPVDDDCLLLCCVDNHTARRAVLSAADSSLSSAIIGGNEYTDASAMFYQCKWAGTQLDPRIRYPEIMTDKTGDPTAPQGCTGLALAASPQLAIANSSAANHMLWLLWFWFAERFQMEPESEPYWPVEHSNTFTRFNTKLIKDI